ncbi:MAG: hypothetical protein ACI4XO_06220 [Akkermansia sp.]
MCERNQGEPIGSYLLRLAVTKPTTVFWMIGFLAAGWIYTDMKELLVTNTEVMRETASALREINDRLEQLESKVNNESSH